MADKNDNSNVPTGLSSDTVIEPFPPQDRDTIPTNALQFENLISGFSAVLIDTPAEELENELKSWMKKFVGFLKVDRCSVVKFSDDRKTIHMLMNYTVPEVDSVPVVFDYQPPGSVIEELEKSTIIKAEKIPDDLPQTFRGGIIEKDKTKSTIIVPLSIGNKVIGSMSFSSYRKERKWPDDVVRRIKLIGDIIANTILRVRSHKALLDEMDRRQKLEERYSSIIKNANVGFWISDKGQNILVVNDEYCRMSGYSREELLSMKISDIDVSISPEKTIKVSDEIEKIGSTHHEVTHRKKDGSFIDLDISSNLIETEKLLFSFMRDITELNQRRKEREERLKFEEVISEFSAALLNIDPNEMIKELTKWLEVFVYFLKVDRGVVNEYLDDQRTVEVIIQYTESEVDIEPLDDTYTTPEGEIEAFQKGLIIVAEKIPGDLPEILRGGLIENDNTKSLVIVPLTISNRIIGSLTFASYRKERKWSDDLVRRIKLIGEIIANAVLRIRAHETLIDEKERRQMLEEKYSSVIKTANVGFMITDLNARILDVNDNYCEMSGYSREELLGMAIYQLDVSHDPDKVDKEKNQLHQDGSYHQEHSHKRKDGTVIDVLVSANLLEREDFVCSFIRDITELNHSRREHEERLKFEELISEFSAALTSINLNDINEELNHWIRRFVDFLKVDRCIINEYQDDKKTVKPLISHTVPDVDIHPPEESLMIPDRIMSQFERGIIIRAEKIPEDLPPQFHGWMIEDHNTKSLLIVPLTAGNQILGNLTFASYRKERKWSDELVSRMKLIGEIVANAILRKRSSDALIEETKRRRRLEERYTAILKTANVGFWISDPNQNILFVNDEYCRMSGYSREELLEMKVVDIDFSGNSEKVDKEGRDTITGVLSHIESKHIRKDGTVFDVEISSNFLANEELFFCFMGDVTELNQTRKELEERLKFEEYVSEFSAALMDVNLDDIRQEISRWLERFAGLLDVDRFTISDYQDDFTRMNILSSYTNPDVEVKLRPLSSKQMTTFGFHKYLIRGDIIKYESLDDTFPEDIEYGMLELKRDGTKSLLLLPLRAGDVLLGAMSISTLTSEKKWTQEQIRSLKLIAEIFANAFMRDRTELELENYRKDLENMVDERTVKLKEAQQELVLSEKMATLGRLTSTVSHELRNPLGTVRSSLFSINRRLKGQDEKTEKALERAERSVQRCDIIIEELLDYSRSQALNLRRTDIDSWLTELLEDEKPPEDIILEKELNAGVSIEIDRERLRRCMINILTNAYQSLEEKPDTSNPGCVRLITKREESGMKIEISDNGAGFAQEDIGKIFEPLYSTKTFGVGLGIPITKQIVEMHGWDMDMKGEPGKGALVTISIPIS